MDAQTQVEEVVNEGVDRLVSQIDRAVELIDKLKRESEELRTHKRQMEERHEEQQQQIAQIGADRDRLRAVLDENASLIENKAAIQQKIEAMLSRLDTVNAA